MKRIRIVGLCLVAVFALGSIMAAAASAETTPEIKVCVKEKHGKGTYATSNTDCAGAEGPVGTGDYELVPLATGLKGKKANFKIKGGAGANFGWVPIGGYPGIKTSATECPSETGEGTYTATGATFKVSYTGCKNEAKSCKTEHPLNAKGKKITPEPGVIVDEKLEGSLVNLPGGKIGISLHAAKTSKTGVLAEYNCEGLKLKAEGGVIGEIQGVTAQASTEPAFNFQAGGDGVQQQWLYPSPLVSEEEGGKEAYKYMEEAFAAKTPVAAQPTILLTIATEGSETNTIPSTQGSKSEATGGKIKIVG